MDSNDDLYFQEILKEYRKEYFTQVSLDLVELFKQALDETVYDIKATTYERTYMLKNSVVARFNELEGALYVYSDINTSYYSAVDGRDVSQALQWFVEEGHSDDSGINNQYHNYQGRHYLEKAQELIEQNYPDIKIEIINDEPPMV
jgi:hypothetical protein